MLPACRTADEPFAIPQFALTRNDIETFMDELREFHTAFRACFARQEPRDQFFNYMVGQCSALERKSIEPMALQVEGGTRSGRCNASSVRRCGMKTPCWRPISAWSTRRWARPMAC